MNAPGVVIVGAGHGGFQAAKSLRDLGYIAPITIVEQQEHSPYQRPPLSKEYLRGTASIDDLQFAPADFYADSRLRIRSGVRVDSIERHTKTVHLSDGSTMPYAQLILATGAVPRQLTIDGSAARGIFGLRTLGEAKTLAAQLPEAQYVVVIGAGFIGLEFANAAVEQGITTTVIEYAPRVLGRAASKTVSAFFHEYLERSGATVLLDTVVERFETSHGAVIAVVDGAGHRHPADLVVVGIGVLPNVGLAESAGLQIDNGIVVDGFMATSDPAISAIGDCCSYPSAYAEGRVRLESVQNATDQARSLAARICGMPQPYREVPWFWSDQGAKKLQIVGLNMGGDEWVLRGSVADGKFSVFTYARGRLIAVESIDRPMDHMSARRLIAAGASVSAAEASDLAFDLKGHAMRVYRGYQQSMAAR